jgi:ferredoxin-NADP reductase
MAGATKFELEFIKKEKESIDAYSFYFKKPHNFNFIPGQYLKLFIDIKDPDERGTSRYFTISSSPTDKDYITITTRILKSTFKLKLNELRSGEKLKAFGPIGYFDFDPKFKGQSIFIAGGISITPFHSILKFIDFKKINSNVILLVTFSSKKGIVFFDELKKIEKRNPNIKVIYFLTKENKNYPKFERGKISIVMIKKYVQNYSSSKFFITGSEKMVLSLFSMLKNSGIPEENIFKEDFPGY